MLVTYLINFLQGFFLWRLILTLPALKPNQTLKVPETMNAPLSEENGRYFESRPPEGLFCVILRDIVFGLKIVESPDI